MELTALANAAIGSPKLIRKLWQSGLDGKPPAWVPGLSRDETGETSLDDPYSILASAAVEFGESFLALDIAEAGIRALTSHPAAPEPAVLKSVRKLGHSKALALLRTGAIATAQDLLQDLYERDRSDLEIAAALARTYKDLGFLADTPALRKRHLERSHSLYFAAFRATGDVFPGINAAATALWLGRRKPAAVIADDVARRCAAKLKSKPADYWLTATLAEAQLILGRTKEASRHFKAARSQIDLSHKCDNLNATRKQARRLCDHLGVDFLTFEKIFRFPKVAVFSGHMFDAPHRP